MDGEGHRKNLQGNHFMKRPPKLVLGMRRGQFLHISEVESGLACGCTSPITGEPLIARKGCTQHHFAHKNGGIAANGESYIHRFAKEVLNQRRQLRVPDASYRLEHVTLPIANERVIDIASAVDEVKIDGSDFIADNLAFCETFNLVIEWKYTHPVDEEKLMYLRSQKLASIEIDISGFEKVGRRSELEDWLLFEAPRKWIFDSRMDAEKLRSWGLNVTRIPTCEAKRFYKTKKGVKAVQSLWIKNCPEHSKVVSLHRCEHCQYLADYDYYDHAFVDCAATSRRHIRNRICAVITEPKIRSLQAAMYESGGWFENATPNYGNGFRRDWDKPKNRDERTNRELLKDPMVAKIERATTRDFSRTSTSAAFMQSDWDRDPKNSQICESKEMPTAAHHEELPLTLNIEEHHA